MKAFLIAVSSLFLQLLSCTSAQSSPSCGPSPSGSIRPSIADGYRFQVVATGLAQPRGIKLDQAGNLLVVEQGRGLISSHRLEENNGCVSVSQSSDLTPEMSLNHGIELSADGRTLFASSSETVYSWGYNPSARTVFNRTTLVTNMAGSDHTTRTLLLSRKAPSLLLITRGSTSNLDFEAADINSGHSQIKAFNISNVTSTGYDFDTSGLLLGWGIRNAVGIAEHPRSGGIYCVENSADQITRMGVDVHLDNPAEKMNFLGYLNGTPNANQGGNFGYPYCFSAWVVQDLPDHGNLTVGAQFSIDTNNGMNHTDAYCAGKLLPRLVFQAHMAPLDIKFNNSGTEGWITFHGSWNTEPPKGYQVSVVAFNNAGAPKDELESMTAAKPIFANQDNSMCPGNCFRPVGMAIDSQGRIFVSSDASGEIYLIEKTAGSGNSSATSSGSPPVSTGCGSQFKTALWSTLAACLCAMTLNAIAM